MLKLLDSFEGLLDRPALAADLRREHDALITELSADLAQARLEAPMCDIWTPMHLKCQAG